ncbi:MAG: nicotinate-nucleotide adenylyltransferase [Candidatus Saganbacteria bacterium]|nr:nicotinate-nucleotide adenylyltransferase [Candidatus Saganbacteria bacterium]
MKRIGILGGTFNPIHKGHIGIAKEARKDFELGRVIFVPTGVPPHKSREGIVDKEHRFKMIKIAISKIPYFSVSRVELDRKGYSYAIDTFGKLKKEFGKSAKLFYIMGLDSINEILSWRKPLDLFKMCEFIVATRPGAKIRTFRRLVKFPPLALNIDKIHLIEHKMDISSSDIRKRLKEGRSVAKEVPGEVLKYIEKNELYG